MSEQTSPPVVKVSIATPAASVTVEAPGPLGEVQRVANRLHADAARRSPARPPAGFR